MATTVVAEDTARARARLGDLVFSRLAMGAGIAILAALAAVFIFLAIEGVPGLAKPAEFYGDASNFWGYVAPLLFGTVLAAVIALVVAVPLAWGIALVVSHYAPKRVATPIAYVIDLLAAVPSVVFGLWGITVLARQLQPAYVWLDENMGWLPFFAGPASGTGRTILTAGLVLAIMILPIITAISREVFSQTPAPPRGGRARARRHALGDDPDGRLPLRPLRHGVRGDARPRSRARRDDGGRDGPLGRRRDLVQPDLEQQPRLDRLQHRLQLQGGRRRARSRCSSPPAWCCSSSPSWSTSPPAGSSSAGERRLAR